MEFSDGACGGIRCRDCWVRLGTITTGSGCSGLRATTKELSVVDHGVHAGHLRDPESARYIFFRLPTKGYAGRDRTFGWVVCATVNSKNGFGGYAGATPYLFLIRNDQVAHAIYGNGKGTFLDGDVYRSCERAGS